MSKKSILIVDDDEKIIKMISFLFLSKGYEVVSARDGVEALEVLETFSPSVFILDLAMPRMDGVALYNKIKSEKRFGHIPVIILSALSASDSMYNFRLPDMRYYVHKPFRAAELQALVTEALNSESDDNTSAPDFSPGTRGYVESFNDDA